MNDARIEEIRYVMRNADGFGSNSSWGIFAGQTSSRQLWLGIRTHDLGGTDYNYVHRVTHEEAKFLTVNAYRLFGHHVFDTFNTLARHTPKPTESDIIARAESLITAWEQGPLQMSVEQCANWLNDDVYPAIVELKDTIEKYKGK